MFQPALTGHRVKTNRPALTARQVNCGAKRSLNLFKKRGDLTRQQVKFDGGSSELAESDLQALGSLA